MQNSDVPLWDKGDSTDDYAKGGGNGFSFFGDNDDSDRSQKLEEAYELVLGRKPTSREIAYYRYATLKQDEIVKKLLKSKEHAETMKMGRDYPELEEREKLDQGTILKLKHGIADQQEEVVQLKAILDEKNREIINLREEKRLPYISQSFLEGRENIYYQNVAGYASKKEESREKTWLDKLADFISKISK